MGEYNQNYDVIEIPDSNTGLGVGAGCLLLLGVLLALALLVLAVQFGTANLEHARTERHLAAGYQELARGQADAIRIRANSEAVTRFLEAGLPWLVIGGVFALCALIAGLALGRHAATPPPVTHYTTIILTPNQTQQLPRLQPPYTGADLLRQIKQADPIPLDRIRR